VSENISDRLEIDSSSHGSVTLSMAMIYSSYIKMPLIPALSRVLRFSFLLSSIRRLVLVMISRLSHDGSDEKSRLRATYCSDRLADMGWSLYAQDMMIQVLLRISESSDRYDTMDSDSSRCIHENGHMSKGQGWGTVIDG
jgi:hypothetical protein